MFEKREGKAREHPNNTWAKTVTARGRLFVSLRMTNGDEDGHALDRYV